MQNLFCALEKDVSHRLDFGVLIIPIVSVVCVVYSYSFHVVSRCVCLLLSLLVFVLDEVLYILL